MPDTQEVQACRICGHARDDHYTYICNGVERTRCKSCDPLKGLSGHLRINPRTAVAKLNIIANHEFVSDPESKSHVRELRELMRLAAVELQRFRMN